ncbi:MAG: preprotein translocase subunit SecE [Patescibacteria group bacterium]|jgi:preprotein translocase subunit SecE
MKTTVSPAIFKGIADELKKVEWPKRQEALHLTFVVVILSLLIGVYIGVLDFGFTKLLTLLINLKK